MSIIIFPGQGSQFIGMGKKLLSVPRVSRMFEIASDILRYDLLSVCLNGPSEELNKTDKCQAAVFVTSMAAVESLKHTHPDAIKKCYATAGFSVGEYASLVLSGALSYEDALRIIKVRSEAMQTASEQTPSGMMSVFLSKKSELNLAMLGARKWCHKIGVNEPVVCEVANYLFSGCKVIGGNKEALEFIEINQKEFHLSRVKRLPVSGAFHTKLMRSAGEPVSSVLKGVQIKRPVIKFYSNYDSQLCESPERIKTNLIKQIYSPVKWEQILNSFYYDENLPEEQESSEKSTELSNTPGQSKDRVYPEMYECGPASQTGPLLKYINKKAFQFYKHVDV